LHVAPRTLHDLDVILEFLSPLFLIGAAAAAVPIVLHLLRREPEPRVRFAAVGFLKRAPVEHTERRRLREWLLLALRIAALALLAVGFARPYVPSAVSAAGARGLVVALDISASMTAPGAFTRARDLAKAAVGRAQPGDVVGLITIADRAEVAVAPTADRSVVLSAIDSAAPGFGATRYRAALEAGVQALDGRRGTIVLVTDLQENGWDAGNRVAMPDSVAVEVADVGPPPPNLAVTSIRVAADRIVASIGNSGGEGRQTRARLALDGRMTADLPVTIAPRSSIDVTFDGASRAASAAVSIDDATGVQADNVRYIALNGGTMPELLFVTDTGALDREAFYLEQALTVEPVSGRAFHVAGSNPSQLSAWDAAKLAENRAVVVLSTRGLERRGREALAAALRRGVGLVIAAGPSVDGEVVRDVLGPELPLTMDTRVDSADLPRSLAPVDRRHPVFQAFQAGSPLGLAAFRRVSRIDAPSCPTLARFSTGEPALVECAAGDGRAIVFASDLDNRWNDLPMHASFVPFLHEVILYVAGGRSSIEQYLIGEVPAGIPPVPGIVPRTGGKTHEPPVLAVNIDPRESDPARLTPEEFQKVVARVRDTGQPGARLAMTREEDRQQLWRVALAFMIGVLALEGIVAGRTA
jgi:hypothetical protein